MRKNTKCKNKEKVGNRKYKQIKENPYAKWSKGNSNLREKHYPNKLPTCAKEF